MIPLHNLKHFSKSPISFMRKMQSVHGDVVDFKLLHKHCLLVSDPGLAKKILKQNNIVKSRMVFDKIIPITGEQGLVQLEGQAWKEQNAHIRPHFNSAAIESYIALIKSNLAQLVDEIAERNVDIHSTIMRYALDNILQILGIPKHSQPPELIEAFVSLNHLCGLRMRKLLPLPLSLPTGFNREIRRQKNKLWQILKRLLSQGQLRENSFIDELSHKLDTEQLIQHISTFLFAGFETTASSISMSLAMLSLKHEEQSQVYRECQSNPLNNLEDIRKLKYTRAFYSETLRLYPPAYMLVREATKAQSIDSIRLKRNHFIIINVHGIHRHKTHWQQSMQFKPERFLSNKKMNEARDDTSMSSGLTTSSMDFQNVTGPGDQAAGRNSEMIQINRDAFLPFGNGQRLCTGNHLAITESLLTIGELIKHYSLSSHQTIKPLTNALVTLHPRNDIWIQFNRR